MSRTTEPEKELFLSELVVYSDREMKSPALSESRRKILRVAEVIYGSLRRGFSLRSPRQT
jgi:hypothetical protein